MPIIRSSRPYRWLQHVAHSTLFKAGRVVWCVAVGYAPGLRAVAVQLLMMGIIVPETY